MRAVDPHSSRFLQTVRVNAGRYNGKTLGEIASSTDGLLYLHNICNERPKWLDRLIPGLIERLLEQEMYQQALRRLNLK